MYICSCCSPPKIYQTAETFRRHKKKYDPTYVHYSELAIAACLEYQKNPTSCKSCQAILPYYFEKSKKKGAEFCSRSCAATFNNLNKPPKSEATKEKAKKSMQLFNINPPEFTRNGTARRPKRVQITKPCQYCRQLFDAPLKNPNKKYCSRECFINSPETKANSVKAGQKSARNQVRRSKDEIKLFDLCAGYYKTVCHNIPLVDGWDADVIIYDTMTAILWNGIWHRKQLSFNNHSLAQVQARDNIKNKVLTKAGWNVVTFEDNEWTPKSAFEWLALKGSNLSNSLELTSG